MAKRIRGKISVQSERLVIVRQAQDAVLHRCPECRANVEMVIAEEAARHCRVSPRTMYRWIEARKVHFFESPNGAVLVCLDSIADRTRR
jgi:hypothetical protein